MQALSANVGYLQSKKKTGSPRAIEYQVFARVTAKLKNAIASDASFAMVAEAVHQNTKLWTALMIDLADERNQMPDELRASLISLGEFSRKHGMLVLSGKETAEPLVEVNTSIMRGLRSADAAHPSSD